MRAFVIAFAMLATVAAAPLPYTGVSLAGGEFGPEPKPGVRPRYGKDFTYPTAAEVDGVVGRGINLVRLPFRWETVQPELGKPLDPAESKRLFDVVRMITAKRCTCLLDPHNYARHYGRVIGGPGVSDADFADLWRRLAGPFAGDDRVWFGLMNEPHDMPVGQWLPAANAAIAAVRAAGAKNMILVPGISWTGAHSWVGSGNAAGMSDVVDPADHWAYEVHQYLDRDSSGHDAGIADAHVGGRRLAAFTAWCRAHHRRAFLGEFAAADVPLGHPAIDDLLGSMEAAPDVWLGWTWWAAGPWWGDYMFTIEPKPDGTDRPQTAWLKPHLHAGNP